MTPHNSVYDDIEQVAATGGGGIGLSELKLPEGEDERVREAMAERDLRSLYCVPASHTILGMSFGPMAGVTMSLQERIDRICTSIERLAPFDPLAIVVAPGASGDGANPVGPVEDVLTALPVIADVAAAHGQTVGFELLGQRRGSPVYTIPDMVAIMDEVGRPNVGLMFDPFHSWPEPDLHGHIREHAHRIVGAQVCDVRVQERSGMDRELPGRGRGVCAEIMATLLESGWNGWWEAEVFSDDGTFFEAFPDSYWAMPHEEFLRMTKKAFDDCYAEAWRIVTERAVTR
ncbi:sugar phosphate isomerase/epimerase family protein [Pseudonocardia dioxanivorans]|jgi:sugar phosphate isomerase/epimerase|uniref:sugar phosphate isomerase/epimerase family protein n=1 Tax=Pseudonocardia dioxanivorans TaxID=240495 RepID=UPI000CD02C6A|nr:sugar phosphate isomerase/epimerase family protein [Pseudonocardia dioxanivorans]